MEIIFEIKSVDQIALHQIDCEKHIVVAIIDDEPCVLRRIIFNEDYYGFFKLNEFMKSNGYILSGKKNIQEVLLRFKDRPMKCFLKEEWFEAMKWINEQVQQYIS